jgi:hypothetical protein
MPLATPPGTRRPDDRGTTDIICPWQLIGDLTQQLHATGADRADNRVPPPDEAARGQLLLGRTAVPASLPENHQSELSPRGRQGEVSPVSGMGEVDHHPVRAGQR